MTRKFGPECESAHKKRGRPEGRPRRVEGGGGLVAVLAPIPSIVHTIHETDLGCAARSTRASRGGHPRDVDPCRCESEDNAPEHRDEAEDSDDDQLRRNPCDERTDPDEHEVPRWVLKIAPQSTRGAGY
mgnify:CR=1 FL=1